MPSHARGTSEAAFYFLRHENLPGLARRRSLRLTTGRSRLCGCGRRPLASLDWALVRCKIGHVADVRIGLHFYDARMSVDEELSQLFCRQHDVAALVARGFTNGEIGERLAVDRETVAEDVERILTTLGFNRRTQIAVWVLENGRYSPEPA